VRVRASSVTKVIRQMAGLSIELPLHVFSLGSTAKIRPFLPTSIQFYVSLDSQNLYLLFPSECLPNQSNRLSRVHERHVQQTHKNVQ